LRVSGLGACLVFSVALNLVGFAPLMSFLLGRAGTSPPSRPQLQVRLLNSHLEPPKQAVVPIAPPKETDVPPPPIPKEKPKVSNHTPPKDAKPIQSNLPEDITPQAKPNQHHPKSAKPAQAVPSGPLTRPDDKSTTVLPPPGTGTSAPFTAPGNATTPAPPGDGLPGDGQPGGGGTPTPTASNTTSPMADNSSQQASPPPVSNGNNPEQGAIPEKPASPRSNPPNTFSRSVLRKLGGKSMIRLQVKIFPDGHIEPQVLVSSGSPELDAAVLKDLRDWKWDPAELAGKPVLTERPVRLKLEAD